MCSPQAPICVSGGEPIPFDNRPMSRSQNSCNYPPRQDCCSVPCGKPPLRCPIAVCVERTKPIRPDRIYESSSAPFNGLTTYKEHYHLKCGPRALSFKPRSTFDASQARMEGLSSYKEAYTPKQVFPYTKPAWAKKAQFHPSDAPMQGISTYRNDYNGCRGERVLSLKPLSQFDPSSAAMEGMTTYKNDYIPFTFECGEPNCEPNCCEPNCVSFE